MKVPILHLSDGVHHIDGIIKKGTLHFYRDEVFPRDIELSVELNKFEKNIKTSVYLKTRMHLICDRCLTEFDQDYENQFDFLFHLGMDDLESDEEDVWNISPEIKEIDITPMIQENLILSIPMKWVCSEDCKGICPGCGADLNKESCRCEAGEIDPRWEQLSKLRNKNA